MIEGLNIRCNIGPVEITRSPLIEVVYQRRAFLSRAIVHIPDIDGRARAALSVGQPVTLRFGYRGEANLWHTWKGTIETIDQPAPSSDSADALEVRCSGQEKTLISTTVMESFFREPASIVARRLMEKTGLSVAEVNIPNDVLPHQVFSNVPVARALKQIEQSLSRSFNHDMSKHAVWLGADGLRWSSGDEPGDILRIETAQNLLYHTPPATEDGMGTIASVLLPGLTASRQVAIRDVRRQVIKTVRAQEVTHVLKKAGNVTTLKYGKESGWGA